MEMNQIIIYFGYEQNKLDTSTHRYTIKKLKKKFK